MYTNNKNNNQAALYHHHHYSPLQLKKEQPTGSTGLVLLPFLVEENLLQPQEIWEKFQNIYILTE